MSLVSLIEHPEVASDLCEQIWFSIPLHKQSRAEAAAEPARGFCCIQGSHPLFGAAKYRLGGAVCAAMHP